MKGMEKLRRLFYTWAYADSNRNYFYDKNRSTFSRMNTNLLFHISGIALCLLAAFFLFSPLLPTTSMWFYSYGAYGLFNAIIMAAASYYRSHSRTPKWIDALCIFYLFAALLFGIIVSVLLSPHSTGSIFLLIASAGQLLFVLPPLYSTATALTGSIVMAFFTYYYKAQDLAMIDMANALCAVVIGGFLCWYIIRLRVREDRSKEEIIALNRRLETLSTVDPLTGLVNRRKFNLSYDETFCRCRKTGDSLAFMMADLDSFKPYNDHYGHIAGDDCLKQVGAVFQCIAKTYGLVAIRYGGEEFALLSMGLSGEQSLKIARELVCSIEGLGIDHAFSPVKPVVTISCGVYCGFVTEGSDKMDFLNLADRALYRAKKLGGNRVC